MQHVHKLRRVNMGRDREYWVMQCSLPGCTTYFAMKTKVSCPSLVGKVSICNSCGDRFALNRRALQQAKPRCDSCVEPKDKKLDAANKFFKGLENELE